MKKIYLTFIFTIAILSVFAQGGFDKPKYQIETHRAGNYLGTFEIELFPLIAPLHVQNFDSLVNDQFYDSTAFHRVVPGFVIQGGDPNSVNGPISTWGQGQPWQVTVPAEFNAVRHLRGRLGAARDTDPNSANSQFYICVANATFLDGNYTVYGQVTNGMDVVDTIVSSPRDANDNPLQKIEMFVTTNGFNDSVPDAPVLNLPADGSTGILNTQNFSWSNVSEAVLYTVEFSTDPSFSNIAISKNSGINFLLVPTLQGSTTYYWRVKSNNGGHESIASNVFSFTSATSAPQLIYPADSSSGISINPVFSWDPVPNADSYTLQVSTSATFTTQSMIYNTAGLTTTSQQVNGLNPNALYYWRVRSASGTIQGFYSVKFSFTTGSSTGIDDDPQFHILTLYPNPVQSFLNGSIRATSGKEITITLSDGIGKHLFSEKYIPSTDNFQFSIPAEKLSNGIYLLTVISGNQALMRKISVAH
jgi:peptidyl-prolyl cis-trans isomerase B (cyclophilin B)